MSYDGRRVNYLHFDHDYDDDLDVGAVGQLYIIVCPCDPLIYVLNLVKSEQNLCMLTVISSISTRVMHWLNLMLPCCCSI